MSKQLLSRLSISLLLALSPALSGRATAAAAKSPKPSAAAAKPGAKAVDPSTLPLDYASVKSYYNDGDFRAAIDIL